MPFCSVSCDLCKQGTNPALIFSSQGNPEIRETAPGKSTSLPLWAVPELLDDNTEYALGTVILQKRSLRSWELLRELPTENRVSSFPFRAQQAQWAIRADRCNAGLAEWRTLTHTFSVQALRTFCYISFLNEDFPSHQTHLWFPPQPKVPSSFLFSQSVMSQESTQQKLQIAH